MTTLSPPPARENVVQSAVPASRCIGDPQGLLPAAGTVEAAMTTFGDQPDRPPQPVANRSNPGQSWT